ncbi:hypothetical protein [Streptomyces sp. SID3212]|uniref:hypothetical protein n=1 Tax=unclassified Streptomyces TaxID=2593676 RepID=UPI00136F1149|nr:hypothetical protein [Streptomyces sp. SID3212]MYV52725.1 hypothetical protein [Streptomyces sp. SID3212]
MTPQPPHSPLPRRTPGATPAPAHSVLVPPEGLVGTAKIQEAVDARDALAEALTAAGIQLPAMDVRTPWPETEGDTDDDAGRATRYALVYLGVCSAPVALALAAVIVKGTGR